MSLSFSEKLFAKLVLEKEKNIHTRTIEPAHMRMCVCVCVQFEVKKEKVSKSKTKLKSLALGILLACYLSLTLDL